MSGRGGGKGNRRSRGLNSSDRLAEIDERLDNLEGHVADIHPDTSERVIDRMHELEKLARTHANSILELLNRHSCRVGEQIEKAEFEISKLEEAGSRHRLHSQDLRQELGLLKSMIDRRSEDCEQQMAEHQSVMARIESALQGAIDTEQRLMALSGSMEELSEKFDEQLGRFTTIEALAKNAGTKVLMQRMEFEAGQGMLLRRSRELNRQSRGYGPQPARGASMPPAFRYSTLNDDREMALIISEAQSCATSRSPSASREPRGGW